MALCNGELQDARLRIPASCADFKSYVFDAAGLQELSWALEKLFVRLMGHISGVGKAISLIGVRKRDWHREARCVGQVGLRLRTNADEAAPELAARMA